MHTFDNDVNPRALWIAVFLAPAGFWITVGCLGGLDTTTVLSAKAFFGMVALAHALPLAALTWTLFSICAVTVKSGSFVIHRVVSDRELPISSVRQVTRVGKEIVRVDLGSNRLLLRPNKPDDFIQALTRLNG